MKDLGPGTNEPTVSELLNFEATWPRHSGRKETAIINTLRIAPGRYYVILRRAAMSLEGQQHDPITAHRVLRGPNNRGNAFRSMGYTNGYTAVSGALT